MAEEIKTILTADSSELAAEFAKASAIAQKYAADRESQGNRALASARAEVEALRLEATGHGAAAAALREKIQLTEQARQLAAKSGLTEANATQILARQLELRKQMATAAAAVAVAEQRAARINSPGSNGLALPQVALTAASLQAMEKGAARAKELRRQYDRAGQGGRNGALGVLAFSQAVEDAQYGIRGVLNNIPQMIMNFGGTAGLAGAISLAAVAGVALYPVLKRLYGAADNEVLKKAAAEWGKVFTEGTKAAREIERTSARTRDLAAWSARVNQQLSLELGIHDQILQSMEREISIREKGRTLATEIRTAEEALANARGKASDPTTGRTEELKRLVEDIRTQRELSERAQAESLRLNEVRQNTREGFSSGETSKNAKIDALRRDLAGAEANVASYQMALEEAKKAGASYYQENRNLRVSTKVRDELKNSLADLEAMRDAAKAQAESADAKAEESIRQMDEKAQKAWQEAEALKALVEQRRILLGLEAQTAAANRWSAWQDAIQKAHKQAVETNAAASEAGQNLTDQAKPEASQQQNRADFAAELAALRLQAGGRASAAAALRKEYQLRSEAARLAKDVNISEAQALELLRRKAALQKQASDAERGRGRGIRRNANGAHDMNSGNNLRDWRWNMGADAPRVGLRNYEVQRRNTERSHRPVRPSEDSAKNLLKSVNLQEQMLKIWQKLNVV